MANVLGTLFTDIANAIRSKTGNTEKMAPIDFPSEIANIVVGSGGSDSGLGNLKINTGSFRAEDNIYVRTIEHGLGVMPDMVIVRHEYFGEQSDGCITFIVGTHSRICNAFNIAGNYYSSTNLTWATPEDTLDNVDESISLGRLFCRDDNTFEVGTVADADNGFFSTYGTYHWIAISGMGGSGGIPTGYHSVTFMNGDNVLFERLVLNGDDCPDPLTQGRIETPTKESTVQYHYTYSGWSEALTNITEDKVIYATFTETVRTYTVTFYDEDGTTVLNTEQVAYGGSSTYTPDKKDDYMFVGWTPEPTNITGDLECIGAWQESYAFADASWEYIAQLAESGQASKAFSVGDTRTETIDGSNFTLEIIGFDHDTITDTGELAGITIWIKDYTKTSATTSAVKATWYDNLHTTYEIPIFNLLSSELQSVIKSVTKEYIEEPNGYTERTGTAKIWSLSAAEIGVESRKSNVEEGTIYEKFANYPSKTYNNSSYTYPDIKTGRRYWLRSFYWQVAPMNVNAAGGPGHSTTYNAQSYVCPCFCV